MEKYVRLLNTINGWFFRLSDGIKWEGPFSNPAEALEAAAKVITWVEKKVGPSETK